MDTHLALISFSYSFLSILIVLCLEFGLDCRAIGTVFIIPGKQTFSMHDSVEILKSYINTRIISIELSRK